MLQSSHIALLQLSSFAALFRAQIMAKVKTWFIEEDKKFHWKEIDDRTMLAGLQLDPNVHKCFHYIWRYPQRQDGNILNVDVDYTVNFDDMTQKNETTQKVRKLLWSFSSGVECTSADAEGCKFLVKVEGEGIWCELADELVKCALLKEDKSHQFRSGWFHYLLDLNDMKQTNISTGKQRDVVVASGGMRFPADS